MKGMTMKKYIVSFVALLTLVSGSAFATQDSDGRASDKREIAGAPGFVPYKEYQLVRYADVAANQSSLTSGDVVVWNCVSDDGVTIDLVGATNSADAVAGVVVSTVIQTAEAVGMTPGIDYGRRNWGWIQVKGYNTNINMVGTAPAAGGAIKASDTARNADRALGNSSAVKVMGFAYDNSTDTEAGIDL
jgi:hypothetical protein